LSAILLYGIGLGSFKKGVVTKTLRYFVETLLKKMCIVHVYMLL